MSYTIEKINAEIEESFVKKYGVCIDGGTPQTATGLEALCRRVYNKGWADCREKMLNKMWIPCSERLPEEETDVLVQWGEHSDMSVARIRKGKWHIHGIFLQEISNPEVITAWKPLPEPYKEENNGQKYKSEEENA